MNTLVYLLAAFICGGLAAHSWTRNRTDPVRTAFAVVAGITGLSYLSFGLYLIPRLESFIYLHALAGSLIPVSFLWFIERLFGRINQPMGTMVRRMWIATPMLGAFYFMSDITLYEHASSPSPPAFLFTTYVMGCLILCLVKLYRIHNRSTNQLQRLRIRYLIGLLGACVFFTIIEQLLRGFAGATLKENLSELGLIAYSRALQGTAPPIGTLFGILFIYFLHQIVQLHRLLDLSEIIGRIFTLGLMAFLLVLIFGFTGIWLSTLDISRSHLLYQLFLSTALFLSFYEPLKERVLALSYQWFYRPGHQLDLTLREIEYRVTKAITMDELTNVLLDPLQGSGRVPLVSLYLWDHEKAAFRLFRQRGKSDHPLMQTIAQRPFTEGFSQFGPALNGSDLQRHVRRQLPGHEDAMARLRTMDAMGAQLTLPIRSGDLTLGWLNLSSVDWSDTFSQEEVRRLIALADKVAIVLENIYSFEEAENQARLAAMGTMAAGLAHEIRNPLAGIKGAAQYLQSTSKDADEAEIQDFLDVIVDEADRLNIVVTQFLDYARPFEIHPIPVDVSRLVKGVIDLVNKENQPEEIQLTFETDPTIPYISLDPDRIRQVLLNLIRNAIQAVFPSGDIVIRCGWGRSNLKVSRGAPVVEIAVTDNGVGIAPEDMKSLFVPFYTTKKQGTGLGLPISQRLVEAHGGNIEVVSKIGESTTFVIHLPIPAEEDFSEDEPTESMPIPTDVPLSGSEIV